MFKIGTKPFPSVLGADALLCILSSANRVVIIVQKGRTLPTARCGAAEPRDCGNASPCARTSMLTSDRVNSTVLWSLAFPGRIRRNPGDPGVTKVTLLFARSCETTPESMLKQ